MPRIFREQHDALVDLLEEAHVPPGLVSGLTVTRPEGRFSLVLEAGVFGSRLVGPAQREHAA
jgi:hypothetical protein